MTERLRALAILQLSNAERMARVESGDPEVFWFLENIDRIAPELLARGWAQHANDGDVRALVVASCATT